MTRDPQRYSGVDTAEDDLLEHSEEAVVARPRLYPDGMHIPEHSHRRAQLFHAMDGVALVTTRFGRWMVPREHALWIPPDTLHSMDSRGTLRMYSIYVRPDALAGLPRHLHVVSLTPLMRALVDAAEGLKPEEEEAERSRFIMGCLLHEIPRLHERPFNVLFPAHRRLSSLCRRFVRSPTPHIDIDSWAAEAGMSRRTFTRVFRRETGLSLSTWRQHACLMAALPRLSAGEPITRVALDLGYESVPAFTTMFKRMLGRPPGAYLRSLPWP